MAARVFDQEHLRQAFMLIPSLFLVLVLLSGHHSDPSCPLHQPLVLEIEIYI